MATLLYLATLLFTIILGGSWIVCGQEADSITEINVHTWQVANYENHKMLVLFYQTNGCELCQQTLEKIAQIVGQPEIPTDVEIKKSSDPELASKLGVTQFPALVYLRDKSYVIYDGSYGVEDLLDWVQRASQKATQTLAEDSFEHLTQASTGATTGDWLVVFYKDSCSSALSALEGLGVRLRGVLNVAKVDASKNPGLVSRFNIADCPEIILFKQGKMYRYKLPALDTASLKSFVEGFYKNVKAEVVPVPKSQFDFLTEKIAGFLKTQIEGENRNIALAGLAGATLACLITLVCCCRSLAGGPQKMKRE